MTDATVSLLLGLALALWLGYAIGCWHGHRIGYTSGSYDAFDRMLREQEARERSHLPTPHCVKSVET